MIRLKGIHLQRLKPLNPTLNFPATNPRQDPHPHPSATRRKRSRRYLVRADLGLDGGHLLLVQGVHVHGAVGELDLSVRLVPVAQGVLHPGGIVALGEVLAGVGAAALLAGLGCVDGARGLGEEVLKLQSLEEVGVPDEAAVGGADVGEGLKKWEKWGEWGGAGLAG
jgi:hypothetical protein